MSYYIESAAGAFVSGLYTSHDDAAAAIKRYIQQAAKRHSHQDMQRKEINRLTNSLRVVRNVDSSLPSYVIDELATELYFRIASNAVGTIYNRALLIGMVKTRIIGTKADYWEITAIERNQALSKLLANTGPLAEDNETGTITRTKGSWSHVGAGNRTQGLYKSSLSRV